MGVVVFSVLVQGLTVRRVLVYYGVGDQATGYPAPFSAAGERLVYRRWRSVRVVAVRTAIQGHSWRSSSRPFFHT